MIPSDGPELDGTGHGIPSSAHWASSPASPYLDLEPTACPKVLIDDSYCANLLTQWH